MPNPFYGVPSVPTGSYLGSNPTIPFFYLTLPWPEFPGPLGSYDDPIGKSYYDALEVQVTKRLSHGISFRGDYTFSKTMAVPGYLNGWPYQDPSELYVINSTDRTHVFTLTGVYDLPKVHGDSSAMRFVGAVANGWRASEVFLVESGFPTGLPGGLYVSGHSWVPDGGSTMGQWLYNCNGNPTACYDTSLPPFALSTMPPRTGSVRNPSIPNLDVSLERNFKVTERFTLQFRGEADNVTNSVLFPGPDTNPNDTIYKDSNGNWEGFGTIQPYQQNFPRIIKFAVKVLF